MNTVKNPAQALSLDESLIWAFGQIKFKVRIITKLVLYRIKVYVLTNAETSYILNLKFYTGRAMYKIEASEEKKTVRIVTDLYWQFQGTHRTIYVDWFYTSIDLLKALDEMSLYVTNTLMQCQVPKHLRIAKSSVVYKRMSCGNYKYH